MQGEKWRPYSYSQTFMKNGIFWLSLLKPSNLKWPKYRGGEADTVIPRSLGGGGLGCHQSMGQWLSREFLITICEGPATRNKGKISSLQAPKGDVFYFHEAFFFSLSLIFTLPSVLCFNLNSLLCLLSLCLSPLFCLCTVIMSLIMWGPDDFPTNTGCLVCFSPAKLRRKSAGSSVVVVWKGQLFTRPHSG